MYKSIDLRQITLVSYGSQFLQGRMPLEDWYQHGAFHDSRFQFRALDDNALLADDFTLWLGMLQRQGATRLSLHLPHELPMCVVAARSDAIASSPSTSRTDTSTGC